jgi:ribonuclease D
MAIHLHANDLPSGLSFGPSVAVDCEMLGLNPYRDRLCVLQLSAGDGTAHLVKFDGKDYSAPNLKKLLADASVEKIFHFARTDLAVIKHWLGVRCAPIFCTKIASRFCRTYTDKHGMKDLIKDLLAIEFSKGVQQTSDWGTDTLTEEQKAYAADDVLYLHRLREKLVDLLKRDNHLEYAEAAFRYLPLRAEMDLLGWPDSVLDYHCK